jgi:ring-1,2-phenylacetyl-CoA epoxidase subunit PaaD
MKSTELLPDVYIAAYTEQLSSNNAHETALQLLWKALECVFDPEIPDLSVVDLGIITNISITETGKAEITITPTFSGCPALHVIKADIEQEVRKLVAAGAISDAEVKVSFETPWNSNRISEHGRAVLRSRGFAPPPRHDGYIALEVLSNVECPYCSSRKTELLSPFGPTLCRSMHYCHSCQQAFEQFKPIA